MTPGRSVVRWTQQLREMLEAGSPGKVAWLFTPRHVLPTLPVWQQTFEGSGGLSDTARSVPPRGIEPIIPNELANCSESELRSIINLTLGSHSATAEFREGVTAYLGVMKTLCEENWDQLLSKSLELVDIWVNLIRNESCPKSASPAIGAICDFAVTAAETIEEQTGDQAAAAGDAGMADSNLPTDAGGGDGEGVSVYLQETLNGLRKHIGKFRNDEANQGTYMTLLSESIRVCLKLRNLQMATSFLKTIPANQPISPHAPRGPAARFRYYYGVLLLQTENAHQAEAPLMWSYSFCPSNKRSILACLVAVRLRHGCIPSPGLLQEYDLTHYQGLVDSMRKGDLALFDETLSRHSEEFYSDATTLCLAKVKFVVERRLVEKTYLWALSNFYLEGEPTNIVPIGLLTAAFKWQVDRVEPNAEVQFDDEEMLCKLGNLIHLGYIKGYIALQQRVLVLSKKSPFPTFAQMAVIEAERR